MPTRSAVLAVTLSVAVIVLAVVSFERAPAPATRLAVNFDDGKGPFPASDNRTASFGYEGGGYRIVVKTPQRTHAVRTFLRPAAAGNVTVEATVVMQSEDPVQSAGLAVYANRRDGYNFLVAPGGQVVICRVTDAFERASRCGTLWNGRTDAVRASGRVNRLSLYIRGTQPAVIVVRVNGERVAEVEDPEGFDTYDAIGFAAASARPNASFLFDDLVVIHR